MRITQNMYYQAQGSDASVASQKLFDVNNQISSGSKIQYSYQDPTSFSTTLGIGDELNVYSQVTSSANNGLMVSQQTDSTMSQFTSSLNQFKTLLLQANSGANSSTSMDALAQEMQGVESQMKNLANTSLNGQYIFSGTNVTQKPIDANGNYLGNNTSMASFLGSNVTQPYGLTGQQLFLGDESSMAKSITTNVPMLNQSVLHPEIMTDTSLPSGSGTEQYITSSDTIRDMMGSSSTTANTTDTQNHFYITGTKHDGSTFKTIINMKDNETVGSLLDQIGTAYGNTANNKVVTVSLNSVGEIQVQDNLPGSSKLDFHMVGNIDSSGPVSNINDLNSNGKTVVDFNQSGVTSYQATIGQQQNQFTPSSYTLNMNMLTPSGGTATSTTPLSSVLQTGVSTISFGGTDASGHTPSPTTFSTIGKTVQDLVNAIQTAYKGTATDLSVNTTNGQINFSTTSGEGTINVQLSAQDSAGNPGLPGNSGVAYDNSNFSQSGNTLTSNVSQMVSTDNSYATDSTKLSAVAGQAIDGTSLSLSGSDVQGNPLNATINFNGLPGGSTFKVNGTTYPILDASGSPTDGNNMTYRQLEDVVSMAVSGNLPATAAPSAAEYNTAITNADAAVSTSLNAQGQLTIKDNFATNTKASISLSDANSSDYTKPASVLQFNANSSLTVSDPKTNFFATIDQIIQSVQQGKVNADASSGNPRNVGIQNAIQMLDNLNSHVSRMQSQSGVQTQSLQAAVDRTQLLTTNATALRSSVSDTDIASATLTLNQLQLQYQAMYSTIAKVSQLSLVNYIN